MPRNPSKPRVSPTWCKYTMCGLPIVNTRIICFKTPITSKNVSPQTIIQHIQASDYKLGLIIDLTDTIKYYDPNEFVASNIVHYKIRCHGMALPLEDTVDHFNEIVQRFCQEHKNDAKLIGVHCFNGVNRTGYLVCRYLVDILKWDSIKAIHAFQDARGHIIEHDNIRNVIISSSPEKVEKENKCMVM